MADSLDFADLVDLPTVGKSEGSALSAGTTGSADTVHIVLDILRNIVIDDSFHIIHINTSGCHIRSDQDTGSTVTETLHDRVTLRLGQISMQSFRLESLLL